MKKKKWLLLVDRQFRDGFRRLPDERFVYYDTSDGSLRCAASLLSQPHLMQESYTVSYLPETGTILTITDAKGNLRTAGTADELPVPEGCWMYGDLSAGHIAMALSMGAKNYKESKGR